ncbi:MAG: hypothetical protein PHX10_09160 [Gallionellaceae bacterium]|nr:hypothetical protein [Gallionellaceae bacterium]
MADAAPRFSLGRLRLAVQLIMLFVTVYGASLVGYYAADKITGSLPALSCAYDRHAIFAPAMSTYDIILEIKYTGFLPKHIADMVQQGSSLRQSASKYTMCRLAAQS